MKEPFDLIRSSLTQYADAATFFGYTVFFTAALPVAPFFALINTYLGASRYVMSCLPSSTDHFSFVILTERDYRWARTISLWTNSKRFFIIVLLSYPLLDIRFNAFSMLHQYRRPVLVGCQDIGEFISNHHILSTFLLIWMMYCAEFDMRQYKVQMS